ncbi:PAS domain-containing sensor histidine kinase [Halorussus salinisoli]|uniref:PAS domain-containing sensor histidine kinase n=1 Tax=Halorussus salinisoli TaxID=2558242 RepID=UPI001484CAD4|nr:PAS domain-containing protein [Halorussus salinisoli]
MSERAEASETDFWEDADESEALRRYRTVVNAIDDGIYQLDAEGQFVAVNDVIVEMTGYARDKLLGEHVSVLLDTHDVAAIEREIERQLSGADGGRETFELGVETADGDRVSCELRLNLLVEDGAFRGTIGVIRDVSDRKRTERELGERERQLERARDLTDEIVESSPVGVVVLDSDGTVTRTNERAREILDISENERETFFPSDRPVYDEHGRPVSVDEHPFAQTLETEEPVYDRLLQVEHPDGERRWLSVSAEPILSDDGDIDRVVTTGEDVTDIKRRERELESELSEIFGRVTDAFYALDAQWRFTHVNERAEELIDYKGEGLVGEDFWEVFEWATDSELGEEYRTAMETQEPTSFEFYYPEPLEAWYEVHAYPSETGLSVYFQDITERKQRERELEESERRYRTLVESFPNGAVALVDDDLRYRTVGGNPRDVANVGAGEIEGRPVREALPKALADELAPRYEAALDGESNSFEAEYDDRIFEFQMVPVRDDDGDVFAALGMSWDVTDRREYQRKLEESERRYRTLAKNFPNGAVSVYDENLCIELTQGSVLGETLPSRDRIEGRTVADVYPESIVEDLDPLLRSAVEEGETGRDQFEFGGSVWQVWATPLRDANGDIFAGLSFMQDITEQVERERKLEEAVEKLEESNERLESFASMLAHELRNPVTIGQIYTQQLPDESAPETVGYVTEAFDRIEDMIDVMLILTRGRDAVGESSPLSLAEVTRDAWEGVDAPDATLEVELDEVTRADETYVQHLFRNLFENAVQHGGPDVTVEVGELPDGFYVADDGDGIPPEDRDAVFEAGFTTAASEGGTGLGLAFVQELADVYGWTYEATESGTGGARFEFTDVEFVSGE